MRRPPAGVVCRAGVRGSGRALWLVLIASAVLPGALLRCGGPQDSGEYELVVAFPELEFSRPVDVQSPPQGSERLFVVEQAGKILSFENRAEAVGLDVFLDIRDRVDDSANEEGLLGLAFHPDYPDSPFVFVDYTATDPDRTVVSRFRVDVGGVPVADPISETVILEQAQPYGNHNGGQIAFGPDQMLYVSLGDGGSGGDPQGHGQNPGTLLGSIVRIDVMRRSDGRPYAIPPDNPFVDRAGYRPEVFAFGLRNAWRFSFDRATGALWAGDVGQNRMEEIDVVRSGGNYGWNVMEGSRCYEPSIGCDQDGLLLPVYEYAHGDAGRSVTGGFVYRGGTLPDLVGRYVFADYVSGNVWALDSGGPAATTSAELIIADGPNIASFGEDASGELYVCAFDGRIHRLVASSR